MKRYLIILYIIINGCLGVLSAQTVENYSDRLLTESFKLFQSADFEMGNHMLPFLEKRLKTELQDSSSFYNPYDNLSNIITIKRSEDGLLKTYCYNQRNGSCCHLSSIFVQFKTPSGQIQLTSLESQEGEAFFITELHQIEIKKQTYYLILGQGSCCGGKHYQVAKLYQIAEDNFIQVELAFNQENQLFVEANRNQEIGIDFNADTQTLSYFQYTFDESSGFYTQEKTHVKWKLSKDGFKQVK